MTAPALTPEELDEACRLAEAWTEGRAGSWSRNEVGLVAMACAALRDERDRLAREMKRPECHECGEVLGDNWCADCAGRINVERVACWLVDSGTLLRANGVTLAEQLADLIRAGRWREWRRPTPEKPATGTHTEDSDG